MQWFSSLFLAVPVLALLAAAAAAPAAAGDWWDQVDVQCHQSSRSVRPPLDTWMEVKMLQISPAAALDEHDGLPIWSRLTGSPRTDIEVCLHYNYTGHELDVSTAPQVDVDTMPVYAEERPFVKVVHPTVYRVLEGQRVELVCSAVGEPEPSVTWLAVPVDRWPHLTVPPYTRDRVWTPGRETPGFTRMRILFEHVTERAAGQYECRAVSEGVWLEQIVELVVVPAVPSSPPVIYTPDTEVITASRSTASFISSSCSVTACLLLLPGLLSFAALGPFSKTPTSSWSS